MSFSKGEVNASLWDVADYTNGRPTKPEEIAKQGIPVIKIAELTRGISSQTNIISKEVVKSKHLIHSGDLLFAWSGTIGIHVYDGPEAALNQHIFKVVARELIDQDFLRYLLESELQKLQSFVEEKKTTMGHVTVANLRSVSVAFPESKEEQRKIASRMASIDRLLCVNNAITKTLEEITETLFTSWFIEFDPVKAKMDGEKPVGMDAATAALFPDSMEDSELGPIPSGWRLQSLSEIGEFRNGLAMQKFPVVDVGNVLPVIKIAQLRAGNTSGADLASGLIDPKFVISDGDILFSWSGTLEIEHWAGGPGALNQHLFKVLGKTVPDWFIFSSSRSHLPEFRKIASGKATTMGHIQRAHLDEAKVAVPPAALLEAVGGFFSALVAKKVALLVENRTLSEIRDALLPRLISGELQIPEEMLAS
jgi:type I restriction enzyme S subunit